MGSQHGPFIVSLVVFVNCGLLGNPTNLQKFLVSEALESFVDVVSITRWSVQMSFLFAEDYLKPNPHGREDRYMLIRFKDVFARGAEAGDSNMPFVIEAATALVIMGLALRVGSY